MNSDIKTKIKQKAEELGFDAIGFTSPELSESEYKKLQIYQERGYCQEMPWLGKELAQRSNPKMLWHDVKTVICLAISIKPTQNQLAKAQEKNLASIAFHAQGDDYHKVIKKRLIKLGKFIKDEFGANSRAFVDTAPVMEKPLAEKAGIGWQGRHSLIVSRKLGVFTLLGELFVDVDIPYDVPQPNHCGSCQKCVEACPTGAISKDGKLDVLKCIAFHLIENKGEIPREIASKMGNKIYGCDDCAKACPFNKFAKDKESILNPKDIDLKLEDLASFDEEKFRVFFAKSGIKRIGFARFKRNIFIAVNNQKN